MRILITGSTGFIGLNLIKRLYEDGHNISVIIRNPAKSHLVEKHADRILIGDLTEPESIENAIVDMDACYHLSGLTKSADINNFYKNNYLASVNLIKEIQKSSCAIKHFIMLSSLAASRPDASAEGVNEKCPPRPVSSYGQSKLLAELYLAKTDLPYTIIRPPIVYGPYDRDVLSFFKMADKGIMPVFGAKKRYSLIYVQDLVESLVKVLGNPAVYGRTYNVGEMKSYTMEEIVKTISESAGKKPFIIPVPEFMLYLIAPLYEFIARITGISPILTRDKLLEIIQDGWVSDSRLIEKEAGFSAEFSLDRGTKTAYNWYKENKWL